jgi:hypothetical protein
MAPGAPANNARPALKGQSRHGTSPLQPRQRRLARPELHELHGGYGHHGQCDHGEAESYCYSEGWVTKGGEAAPVVPMASNGDLKESFEGGFIPEDLCRVEVAKALASR